MFHCVLLLSLPFFAYKVLSYSSSQKSLFSLFFSRSSNPIYLSSSVCTFTVVALTIQNIHIPSSKVYQFIDYYVLSKETKKKCRRRLYSRLVVDATHSEYITSKYCIFKPMHVTTKYILSTILTYKQWFEIDF